MKEIACKIFSKGFKLKYILFLFRLSVSLVSNRFRVTVDGFLLSLEKGVVLRTDKNSHISISRWCYLSRMTNVEACDGSIVNIGDHFFSNKNCSIVSRYGVDIGDSCQLGPNVNIYDHNHDFKSAGLLRECGYYGSKITIGNNVWIGAGSFIGAGVKIGDNCVIGCNTVVLNDIPSNTVFYNKVVGSSYRI